MTLKMPPLFFKNAITTHTQIIYNQFSQQLFSKSTVAQISMVQKLSLQKVQFKHF